MAWGLACRAWGFMAWGLGCRAQDLELGAELRQKGVGFRA